MTDDEKTPTPGPPNEASTSPGEDEAPTPRIDEQRIRSILRSGRFLNRAPPPDLLGGVQRKIRERSKGKFYGDGWSRSRSPTSTYVVTCLLMLVILSIVYFVLMPALPVP